MLLNSIWKHFHYRLAKPLLMGEEGVSIYPIYSHSKFSWTRYSNGPSHKYEQQWHYYGVEYYKVMGIPLVINGLSPNQVPFQNLVLRPFPTTKIPFSWKSSLTFLVTIPKRKIYQFYCELRERFRYKYFLYSSSCHIPYHWNAYIDIF
jgi:hypothetical protein